MYRRERRAQVQPDERGLAAAERPARLNRLLERLAAHELHPQADAVVVLLGTVHLHHVRMTNARQPARLVEQSRVRLGVIAFVVQQLQRDFAVKRRVPRAVDLAGRALADAIEQRESAPMRAGRAWLRGGFSGAGRRIGGDSGS